MGYLKKIYFLLLKGHFDISRRNYNEYIQKIVSILLLNLILFKEEEHTI